MNVIAQKLKKKLKIGDTVRIYQKPLTNELFEGYAKIIELLHGEDINMYCSVKFVTPGGKLEIQLYNRWVSVDNLIGK